MTVQSISQSVNKRESEDTQLYYGSPKDKMAQKNSQEPEVQKESQNGSQKKSIRPSKIWLIFDLYKINSVNNILYAFIKSS